jgi:hypothetical protein
MDHALDIADKQATKPLTGGQANEIKRDSNQPV